MGPSNPVFNDPYSTPGKPVQKRFTCRASPDFYNNKCDALPISYSYYHKEAQAAPTTLRYIRSIFAIYGNETSWTFFAPTHISWTDYLMNSKLLPPPQLQYYSTKHIGYMFKLQKHIEENKYNMLSWWVWRRKTCGGKWSMLVTLQPKSTSTVIMTPCHPGC